MAILDKMVKMLENLEKIGVLQNIVGDKIQYSYDKNRKVIRLNVWLTDKVSERDVSLDIATIMFSIQENFSESIVLEAKDNALLCEIHPIDNRFENLDNLENVYSIGEFKTKLIPP